MTEGQDSGRRLVRELIGLAAQAVVVLARERPDPGTELHQRQTRLVRGFRDDLVEALHGLPADDPVALEALELTRTLGRVLEAARHPDAGPDAPAKVLLDEWGAAHVPAAARHPMTRESRP